MAAVSKDYGWIAATAVGSFVLHHVWMAGEVALNIFPKCRGLVFLSAQAELEQ